MAGKMVKTRLPENLYRKVLEYADRNGVSVYEAVRRLVESGLKHEDRIYRLVNDDDFILSLITVRVKYDPSFAHKIARVMGDGEDL